MQVVVLFIKQLKLFYQPIMLLYYFINLLYYFINLCINLLCVETLGFPSGAHFYTNTYFLKDQFLN